jgi:hypothetical protein
MKAKHLFLIPFLLVLFIYQGCKEEQIVEQTVLKKNEVKNDKSRLFKESLALPEDPPVITWVRIGYVNTSDPNIKVGIAPKTSWMNPFSNISPYRSDLDHKGILKRLRYKWGFNVLNTIHDLIPFAADSCGFTPRSQSIMAGIDATNPSAVIASFSDHNSSNYCWAYYADEPISNSRVLCDYNVYVVRTKLTWEKDFFKGIAPASLFISGETMKSYAHEFDDIVDCLSMTYYNYYWYSPCGPIDMGPDQREDWEDFAYAFGDKFKLVWISGETDMGEFDGLIQWAYNWGRPRIFLYAGEEGRGDGDYYNAINDFCDKAYKYNYLWARERQYINGVAQPLTRIVNYYLQEMQPRENYTYEYDN